MTYQQWSTILNINPKENYLVNSILYDLQTTNHSNITVNNIIFMFILKQCFVHFRMAIIK